MKVHFLLLTALIAAVSTLPTNFDDETKTDDVAITYDENSYQEGDSALNEISSDENSNQNSDDDESVASAEVNKVQIPIIDQSPGVAYDVNEPLIDSTLTEGQSNDIQVDDEKTSNIADSDKQPEATENANANDENVVDDISLNIDQNRSEHEIDANSLDNSISDGLNSDVSMSGSDSYPDSNMAVDLPNESTNVNNDEESSNISSDEDNEKPMPYEDEEEKKKLEAELLEKTHGIEMKICTKSTDRRNPLHLSHPENCGKFYKCYGDRAYLMECAGGLHFSVNTNRCEFPYRTKCKADGNYHYKLKKARVAQASATIIEDVKPEEKPETGDFEIDPRCDGSDPFKPLHMKHPNDCSKFYKCYLGRAYVVKCPKSQQWAQHLNRCEHASLARCSVMKPSIRPAQFIVDDGDDDDDDEDDDYNDYTYRDVPNIMLDTDYKIRDERCLEAPKDRFHPIQFVHPTNCGQFYKCLDGFAYKNQCPFTLHYNEESEFCDYPESAGCKSIVEASVVEAKIEEYLVPKCKSNGDKFSVPESFTSYFECENEIPYLKQCRDHELFNPILKACEKVSISDDELMSQMIMLSNQKRPSASVPNFVDPSFSVPHVNQPAIKPPTIPKPQVPQQQIPNFPHYQQFPSNNYYPGMMQNYPFMNQNNYMPDWSQMINGQQHQQYPMQPDWSMLTPGMNFPIYANNPLESDTQKSTDKVEYTKPVVNFEKPAHAKLAEDDKEFKFELGKVNKNCPMFDDLSSEPVHLAHESQCGMFYKCYEGRAFLMECPKDQEWSDELQRCDFHENAGCESADLIKNHQKRS